MLRVSPTTIFALLLFFGVFSLYLYTSPPGATHYADSSELITASYTLGIPHPPGYPIFVLVGKLFSFIPFGEIAFRYAIMSSLLGALTVMLVYLILVRILSHKAISHKQESFTALRPTAYGLLYVYIPALTGALSLAFSYIFWLYSIVPEVWAFNSFFTAFLLYLGVRWYYASKRANNSFEDRISNIEDRMTAVSSRRSSLSSIFYLLSSRFRASRDFYPFILALTFSPAFLSHQVIILLIPAFLYLIWITDPYLFLPTKRWLKILPGFIIGFTPVLYFFWASARYTPIDVGNVHNLENLWQLLSRHYYGEATGTGHAYLQTALRLENRLAEIPHYLGVLQGYLSMPILILGIVGMLWLVVLFVRGHRKAIGNFVLLAFVVSGLFFAMYTTTEGLRTANSYNLLAVQERMYSMGMVSIAILVGFGAFLILRIAGNMRMRYVPLVAPFILILALYPLMQNFSRVNKNTFYLGEDYAENLFAPIEQNGILFTRGDMPTFAALYYSYVKHKRPDVTVIYFVLPPWQRALFLAAHPGLWDEESNKFALIVRDIIRDNIGKRPLYTTGLLEDEIWQLGLRDNPWVLSPRGPIMEITEVFEPPAKDFWADLHARSPLRAEDHYDWFAKEIVQQYVIGHYNNFSAYLRYGYNEDAERELEEMKVKDPHARETRQALTRWEKETSGVNAPKDVQWSREELGVEGARMLEQRRLLAAFGIFAYLAELEPDNSAYRTQFAEIMRTRGWAWEAERELRAIGAGE